ncbi:hypothetical protein ACZ90_49560 [Streptomyces albus subsp. albus]|nr:hypothetical protein ACZ90_49560 [Streptomyces albus subsp. albus]
MAEVFRELTSEDPERVGPYRIVARLGAGGMGRVYLGRSRGGRPVAVKVVRPELAEDEHFRRRFAREVAAARQVNGVFTAGVVDADPDGAPPWLATAYVQGVSLEAAVGEHGALPETPVLALGAGLAEALEAIHAAGVVHRDLKPSNVLLAADGPRVIDFGISAVHEATAVTKTGSVVGTPGFMSPEQLTGRPVRAASDVFSLGAVLVFAATGTGPFGTGPTHGVLFRTVYEEPDLTALPAGLADVARWCLAKDPAGRPSVAELADEFARRIGDGREVAEILSGGGWLPRAVEHTLTRAPVPPAPSATPADAAGDRTPPAPTPERPAQHEAAPAVPEADTATAPPPPPTTEPTPPTATPPDPVPPLPATPPPSPGGAAASFGPAPAPFETPPPTAPVVAGPTGHQPPHPRPVTRRAVLSLAALATVGTVSAAVVWGWPDGESSDRGGGSSGAKRPGTKAPGPTGRTTTVALGVSVPLTGDLASFGLGIKNSVDLAVRTANKDKEVPGVTFKVVPVDDKGQPETGRQGASTLVGDSQVLGVVGPLNSSVAQSTQPVFDDAHLAQVSPAATNPLLTQGDQWSQGAKRRPYASFFRTVSTDAHQGPYAARYLARDLDKSKAFVVSTTASYGTSLADGFSARFRALGGKVVGEERIAPDDRDFSALVDKVKDSRADVVYFGGEYPEAGPLSKQLKAAGVGAPLVGGDGIYSDQYISLAGAKADGDLCVTVGAPVGKLDSARTFIAEYQRAGYPDDHSPYGGYAYDSAWALIQAVKAVVTAHQGTLPDDARAQVVQALQRVSFDGVTGPVAFDGYGDTTQLSFTVNRVAKGKWTVAETGTDDAD